MSHNHVTRDIKPKGQCPACDEYHAKVEAPPETYALEINAEGYPRNVGPFDTRNAAGDWIAGRKLTGSWSIYPITAPDQPATPFPPRPLRKNKIG